MAEKARVTTVARFPPHYFLENIVVRRDGSILITAYVQKRLYYLPNPGSEVVKPQLLREFDHFTTGIVEVQPDVFYLSTTTVGSAGSSQLWKLDMNGYSGGSSKFPEPVPVLTLPRECQALNGSALLSPSVIILADSWADLIWRVDIPEDGSPPSVRVWLKHEKLAHDPKKRDSPGVNGLKYHRRDQHVYFTTTAQMIFGRIPVDPVTYDPVGEPVEVTERGLMGDDLLIDDAANVAYVTTHRQNTIERFDLGSFARVSVVGNPLDSKVLGPTAGAWGRAPGEAGRVAYFITDGGHMHPYEGGTVQDATVVRIEFPPPAGH